MSFVTLLLIAVGLSMDSFSVAVAIGASKKTKPKVILKLAVAFMVFHVVMTLAGWISGKGLQSIISGIDHWIAFGLLSVIGGKMIYEGVRDMGKGAHAKNLNSGTLIMLSIATSIDALVIGIGFAFLKISLLPATTVIGVVIFVMTCAGVVIGGKFRNLIGKKAEIAGGMTLIFIGTKILVEHLGYL